MDANTAGVLNSILNIVSIIVTALMVIYVNRNNKKISTVETKLDENHKLQNGHMTALLETTKKLATATEKARGEAQDKKESKK